MLDRMSERVRARGWANELRLQQDPRLPRGPFFGVAWM